MEAVYTETRKGYTITVYPDYDCGYTPDEAGDDLLFLVHYHRDFEITRDGVITEDDTRAWYQGETIPQAADYHIFAVSAYIHSGVSLALGTDTAPFDPGGWDTSHVGLVLVERETWATPEEARAAAESLIREWNLILGGSVYGYTVTTAETCPHCGHGETVTHDSCWGYIGDYDDENGLLDEVRAIVDTLEAAE